MWHMLWPGLLGSCQLSQSFYPLPSRICLLWTNDIFVACFWSSCSLFACPYFCDDFAIFLFDSIHKSIRFTLLEITLLGTTDSLLLWDKRVKKHKYPLAQWPIISLYTEAGIYVKPWLHQVQLFSILSPQLFQRLECQPSVMSLCFLFFFLLSNISDHSEHSNGHVKRTNDVSSIHSLPVRGFLLILLIYLLWGATILSFLSGALLMKKNQKAIKLHSDQL